MSDLPEIPLGKTTAYPEQYDASLLFPVPRQLKRDEIGVSSPLPFYGQDQWNGYELSWLNCKASRWWHWRYFASPVPRSF